MRTLGRNVVAAATLTACALSALANPAAYADTPPPNVKKGVITHDDALANYRACGTQMDPAAWAIASPPAAYWTTDKSGNDPLCQKFVRLDYQGKTYKFRIGGRCSSCAPNQLNLSQPAFEQVTGKSTRAKIELPWGIRRPS
ncbi:MAG TPA: hypothetical protein VM347_18275 [Nonomuraea sp.]|nr:hypothetical protein [Nonomuraea sp.]